MRSQRIRPGGVVVSAAVVHRAPVLSAVVGGEPVVVTGIQREQWPLPCDSSASEVHRGQRADAPCWMERDSAVRTAVDAAVAQHPHGSRRRHVPTVLEPGMEIGRQEQAMEIDVGLGRGVELLPVRLGLGIQRCDRRLSDVVAKEPLRAVEQRLALTRAGDGEPHVPGVLAADLRDRNVLPGRGLRLREVAEITAEQPGQVRVRVRVTRHEHLERRAGRHDHDALVL